MEENKQTQNDENAKIANEETSDKTLEKSQDENILNEEKKPKKKVNGYFIFGIIVAVIGFFIFYFQFSSHTYTFDYVTFTAPQNLQLDKNDETLLEFRNAISYKNYDYTLRVFIAEEPLSRENVEVAKSLDRVEIEKRLRESLDIDKIDIYEKNDKLIYIGGSISKYHVPAYGYAVIDIPHQTGHIFFVAASPTKKNYEHVLKSIFESVKVDDIPLYKAQDK